MGALKGLKWEVNSLKRNPFIYRLSSFPSLHESFQLIAFGLAKCNFFIHRSDFFPLSSFLRVSRDIARSDYRLAMKGEIFEIVLKFNLELLWSLENLGRMSNFSSFSVHWKLSSNYAERSFWKSQLTALQSKTSQSTASIKSFSSSVNDFRASTLRRNSIISHLESTTNASPVYWVLKTSQETLLVF